MRTPKELKYTKTHEWILIDRNTAKVGITDYAQETMGDIVYISLPSVGDEVSVGDEICDIESVKAVSGSYSPLEGTVIAVNEDLEDDPGLINREPWDTWIFEAEFTALGDLMSAEEYDSLDKE